MTFSQIFKPFRPGSGPGGGHLVQPYGFPNRSENFAEKGLKRGVEDASLGRLLWGDSLAADLPPRPEPPIREVFVKFLEMLFIRHCLRLCIESDLVARFVERHRS